MHVLVRSTVRMGDDTIDIQRRQKEDSDNNDQHHGYRVHAEEKKEEGAEWGEV